MNSVQFVEWLKGYMEGLTQSRKPSEAEQAILDKLKEINPCADVPYNPDWFKYVEYDNTVPDKVPYGSICSCNPANGGSGICGCTMGNEMVPNPKKYNSTSGYIRFSTTTTNYPTDSANKKELLKD